MTNQLFRDYLDGRIPGHETPRTVTVTITPEIETMTIHGHRYTRSQYATLMQTSLNAAYENLRMAAIGALRTTMFTGAWVDYGAQRGLTGLERAHFNDAVEKMARTTGWSRADSARNLGIIMDAAERAELDPRPADPRAYALAAKQHRGTGPASEALKHRGRVTHYRTKG